MEQLLDIGKIVNTHGTRGEIKALAFTDYPERFEELDWVYVERGAQREKKKIESVKYFKGTVILKLQGIEDMTQAEGYKNAILRIDRKNARNLPEGSYLICEIIGLKVFSEDGTLLGSIADVLETGSNDVYVVKRENKKDILLPALKSAVLKVDIAQGNMQVKLPEGLVEDEEE